jgi:hypothetical protein
MRIRLFSFIKNEHAPINFFGHHQGESPEPNQKPNTTWQWWTPPQSIRAVFDRTIVEGKSLAATITAKFWKSIPNRIALPLVWTLVLNVPTFLYITSTDWYAQLLGGIHWKHLEMAQANHVEGMVRPTGEAKEELPPPLPTALVVGPLPLTRTPLDKPVTTAITSSQPVTQTVKRQTAYRTPTLVHATRQEEATYFNAPLKIDGALFVSPVDAVELPKGTPGNSLAGRSGKSTGTSSVSPLGTPQ